jgi:hypothetical protein
MNIHAYIKDFYQAFIQEYKTISAAKDSMLGSGYTENHYNDLSPTSDLIYPVNKNHFYKRDQDNTEQNKFIGLHLYTKENPTLKFFNLVKKNPILNLAFPEKDNFKYNLPKKHEYFNTFSSKFSHLSDLNFVSPSTNNEIRFEHKKIILLILDTPRRKNIIVDKYFTITINGDTFKLKDQFDAMYFLSDAPISIKNPYYPKLFMYAARFEFENYLNLIPKAAML